MRRSNKHSRKWFRNKSPEKTQKLINCSHQAIFWNDHYSDQRFDTPARPKFLRFAFVRKNVKNAIFKTSLVLQPQGLFVVSKHKCVKKSNLKKKQTCKRPQKCSQNRSAKSRRLRTSKRNSRHALAQNRSQNPCFEVFRVFAPLRLHRYEPTRPRRKQPPKKSLANEGGHRSSKMAFLQWDPISQLRFSEVKFAKCKPEFRTAKLTHKYRKSGPDTNPPAGPPPYI